MTYRIILEGLFELVLRGKDRHICECLGTVKSLSPHALGNLAEHPKIYNGFIASERCMLCLQTVQPWVKLEHQNSWASKMCQCYEEMIP